MDVLRLVIKFPSHNLYRWNNLFRGNKIVPNFTQTVKMSSQIQAQIIATPQICLMDVPTHLKIVGLQPNIPVTLRAEMVEDRGKLFCSTAHYVSNEQGVVDVESQPSLGGSYTGIFPHGLLTCLVPGPNEFKYSRVIKTNYFTPHKIKVTVTQGHLTYEDSSKAIALNEIVLSRLPKAPGVQRIPIRKGAVRGVLYMPPGDGPFPGVIDMYGGIGGVVETRAAMMASHDIASLALAYFNYDDLPNNLDEFELEYFEEAIDILLSTPRVIPDRCGVVCVCQGAGYGFLMGTYLSKVKAVFAINPQFALAFSTITHNGKVLMKPLKFDDFSYFLRVDPQERIYFDYDELKDRSNFLLNYPSRIRIEDADEDTVFHISIGTEDKQVFGKYHLSILEKYLEENGKGSFIWEFYEDAGHIIEPPYMPFVYHSYQPYWPSEKVKTDSSGVVMLWGGEVKSTCRAQEKVWSKMLPFIKKNVKNESDWYQAYLTKNLSIPSKL